ncbi:MAG TPA: hypothetical protein VHG93_26170 [Longimicrobium sp.]|nr:hypothetical protein [Longimicrobium sp.]
MKRSMTRGVLAAAFAAAMGFGAAQAVAAPEMKAAAACQQDVCTRKCAMEGLTGICSGRGCWCR